MTKIGKLTYLTLFLCVCHSLIHLSVSLYLCLSVSHLHFHSLITVSGPKGVFPLGWQQQGDRGREGEERETGRPSSGEAWQTPPVIFPPPPIDSVSSASVSEEPAGAEGLDNMPSSAIRGTYHRHAHQSEARGSADLNHCIATFSFLNITHSSWEYSSCICFFLSFHPFPQFLLVQTTNSFESNPCSSPCLNYYSSSKAASFSNARPRHEQGAVTKQRTTHVLSNASWRRIYTFPMVCWRVLRQQLVFSKKIQQEQTGTRARLLIQQHCCC